MIPVAKPYLEGNEKQYVLQVLETGRLAMGAFTEKFEEMFCDYLGTKYAIACSSGTMGLYICFEILNEIYGKNECYCVSDETFGATMNAISMSSGYAYPVSKLTENSLEVYVPCHIFGLSAPDFVKEEIKYDYMIEDACESLGASHDGFYLGTFGSAGVFGFYPNKQITTGEGGMIVTDNKKFADICRKIVNQGRTPNEPHTIIGTNARLTEMQAAIGVAQMERIDEILEKRRDVAQVYIDGLDASALSARGIEVPVQRDSWFAFPLTLSYPCKDQKEMLQGLQAFLSIKDIQSSIYFPRHESFPDFIWERRLCIPFYTKMSKKEIGEVVHSVNEWVRE